jgi:hypothetical protein
MAIDLFTYSLLSSLSLLLLLRPGIFQSNRPVKDQVIFAAFFVETKISFPQELVPVCKA